MSESEPITHKSNSRSGPLREPRSHGIGLESPSVVASALLFILILSLGAFARLWEFNRLPPGLNADEASIGVEAWNLLHSGADRNGLSWPVHFVSWGGGQNALYGYILLPFVAALGLKPVAVRLPMLITGILSLPIIYAVGHRMAGRRLGLVAMFLLSISPWHILLSRWGLESNILPFMFLLGFACLLHAQSGVGWFVAACTLFGLCLYAYGTAYAVMPVFMIWMAIILVRNRFLTWRTLSVGLAAFVLVASPVALFLTVNTIGLDTIRIGPISLPRYPVEARYSAATLLGASDPLHQFLLNLRAAVLLLATESDGLLYNVVEPYGVFYHVLIPLAALGMAVSIADTKAVKGVAVHLLWAWLGAAFIVAVFQAVNINRFNIAYLPLLLFMAYACLWLSTRSRAMLPAGLAVLLAAFAAFTIAYHGVEYRRQAEWKFNHGLLPALTSVRESGAIRVCVTDKITMPYIFTLFSAPDETVVFLRTVRYANPYEPLRRVTSYGRYTFGVRNCVSAEPYTYVLTAAELPPRLGNRYEYAFFDNFVVYSPRQ